MDVASVQCIQCMTHKGGELLIHLL